MLIIAGYEETLDVFRQIQYCPNVLAINDPDIPSLYPEIKQQLDHYLELRFHDLSEPEPDAVLPSSEDIEQIKQWAHACDSENALIHCGAGISRSTAAALITLCEWGYSVSHAVQTVLTRRPMADPNSRMLKLYGNPELEQALASIQGNPFI